MHNIHLDQFEGPLDLLLYFIRRDEIDIYDIPISKITYDYLNVIDKMNSLNVSIAGEFVLMAATLMKIKSKILIPRQELNEEGEIIDPRTDLVNKLIEYQQFKTVSNSLDCFMMKQIYHTPENYQRNLTMRIMKNFLLMI